MSTKLPSITIVIPTYNEEKNIKDCLDSIILQDYPKSLLEIFIVDNYSQDKTLEIAKKYPAKIIMNKTKDAQSSKMIAFRKAKGELFFYMDADLRFRTRLYLKKMVKPLLENPQVIGSFTKMYQIPGDSSINRFLTYDPLQKDPVYEYFSSTIESTIKEKRSGYYICEYSHDKIPPAGRCLYWMKKIKKTKIAKGKKFMELDNLVILVEAGYTKFAYVPDAGEYHKHIENLKQLIKKRLRNIRRNYIPDFSTRYYKWFDLRKPNDFIKIIIWIFYVHTLVLPTIRGIYKAIKFKDIVCVFYEPFLSIVLTDIILYGFLGNNGGWKMLRKNIFNLI